MLTRAKKKSKNVTLELFSNLDAYSWVTQKSNFWDLLANINNLVVELIGQYHGSMDPTAFIHPGAIVTGSFIGRNVQIYEGCTVRNSVIWDNSVIGHGSEVARSVVLRDCFVPRFNYIGGSFLGERVQLGGVVSLATRRHDNQPIVISWGKERVSTNYHKMGSIIGDDVVISFGSHLNPGTVVGRESIIMPHVDLRGYVPPRSMVYNKQETVITRRRRFLRLEE